MRRQDIAGARVAAAPAARGRHDTGGTVAGSHTAGQVRCKLTFSEDTWVEVYDGSGAPCSTTSAAGAPSARVRADRPLSVTIGDPDSVAVYANGRRLAVPAAPAGQSLTRFSIDADGRRALSTAGAA